MPSRRSTTCKLGTTRTASVPRQSSGYRAGRTLADSIRTESITNHVLDIGWSRANLGHRNHTRPLSALFGFFAAVLYLRSHLAVCSLCDRFVLRRMRIVDASWQTFYQGIWVSAYEVDERVALPCHAFVALNSVCQRRHCHTVER